MANGDMCLEAARKEGRYYVQMKESVNLGHGPWEQGYQPSGVNPTEFDGIRTAALALVDAMERYTRGECLRSELLNIKETLKTKLQ